MNRRTLILALVLILLAGGFFVASNILINNASDSPTPTTTEENQQPEDVIPEQMTKAFPLDQLTMENLSVQADAEFDFAFGKAKEWRQDAVPMAVTIKYSESISVDSGKNTYVFFSPSLGQYYFTVTIDQAKNDIGENNFERVIYYKEDYFLPNDISALPLTYWVTDYLSALELADSLGGEDVRSGNANYDVNMFLFAREGEFLNWNVEYLVSGIKQISVPISAYTGEAITQ